MDKLKARHGLHDGLPPTGGDRGDKPKRSPMLNHGPAKMFPRKHSKKAPLFGARQKSVRI
jgi:hypothetical protein